MGCGGCELYPTPAEVLRKIDAAVAGLGAKINSRALLTKLIHEHYSKIKNPGPGHRNAVTITNLWHFRDLLCNVITKKHGRKAGHTAMAVIKGAITCYAAKLHFNRGANILSPHRKLNKGYAPTFEQVTSFEGRMAQAAGWKDLLGCENSTTPWKDSLPRMIFVSDMGDAFSAKGQFPFLEREVMPAITSEKGLRHLWLWLTKRANLMREFSARVGGLPPNVCAMTTVTGPETLHRVDELRHVRAACRGLSIEPLWKRIAPCDLDLTGIDWLILGGESGSGSLTRPFHMEWAEELLEHCQSNGVAFFLKQLGRNPVIAGKPIRLVDTHGGDWNEWPRHLRVREFPEYFHGYRLAEKEAASPPWTV